VRQNPVAQGLGLQVISLPCLRVVDAIAKNTDMSLRMVTGMLNL
jgi:hypothetical protein